MSDSFDEVYLDTRRQLRGVAESLIAGPQYRASGTIRLAVRPDGFGGPAQWFHRSHYAGGHAIKKVLPEAHPVLWPGDDDHPTPYAYVQPWAQRTGPFWNAPFGALYPLAPAHDVDALTSHIAEFFQRGRREL